MEEYPGAFAEFGEPREHRVDVGLPGDEGIDGLALPGCGRHWPLSVFDDYTQA
jgi:hypothetical protein